MSLGLLTDMPRPRLLWTFVHNIENTKVTSVFRPPTPERHSKTPETRYPNRKKTRAQLRKTPKLGDANQARKSTQETEPKNDS